MAQNRKIHFTPTKLGTYNIGSTGQLGDKVDAIAQQELEAQKYQDLLGFKQKAEARKAKEFADLQAQKASQLGLAQAISGIKDTEEYTTNQAEIDKITKANEGISDANKLSDSYNKSLSNLGGTEEERVAKLKEIGDEINKKILVGEGREDLLTPDYPGVAPIKISPEMKTDNVTKDSKMVNVGDGYTEVFTGPSTSVMYGPDGKKLSGLDQFNQSPLGKALSTDYRDVGPYVRESQRTSTVPWFKRPTSEWVPKDQQTLTPWEVTKSQLPFIGEGREEALKNKYGSQPLPLSISTEKLDKIQKDKAMREAKTDTTTKLTDKELNKTVDDVLSKYNVQEDDLNVGKLVDLETTTKLAIPEAISGTRSRTDSDAYKQDQLSAIRQYVKDNPSAAVEGMAAANKIIEGSENSEYLQKLQRDKLKHGYKLDEIEATGKMRKGVADHKTDIEKKTGSKGTNSISSAMELFDPSWYEVYDVVTEETAADKITALQTYLKGVSKTEKDWKEAAKRYKAAGGDSHDFEAIKEYLK